MSIPPCDIIRFEIIRFCPAPLQTRRALSIWLRTNAVQAPKHVTRGSDAVNCVTRAVLRPPRHVGCAQLLLLLNRWCFTAELQSNTTRDYMFARKHVAALRPRTLAGWMVRP